MTFFPGIEAPGSVGEILQFNKAAGRALVEYHLAVLRQPSPLSEGERELIAAFVSSLNACQYCAGVHTATAEAFGLPEGLITTLVDDFEAADIDEKLRPILAYVRKLTLDHTKMVNADADAVFAAGWNEQALHDAISVCCLFNFMNRLLEGHGIKGSQEVYQDRGQRLMAAGYAPILELLKD
ncbi:MAG: carboxymuconolactone decarboxylase family protein [Alphaproteobacteria bacterium]